MTPEFVKRIIYYYELNFKYKDDFKPSDANQFRELFRIITQLAKNKHRSRYQTIGEKEIFMQQITFETTAQVLTGKLKSVRKDLFPELINTNTDTTRDIDADDEEGISETTHFAIDFSKNKKKIAIEFNQDGAKIGDFVSYIQALGVANKALTGMGFRPIIDNKLAELKDRINRCSEFIVKIHKDNIPAIKAIDGATYTAAKTAQDQFRSEYATISLKFDYRQRIETKEVNKSIFNLSNHLSRKPEDTELFNVLSVKAEDSGKNNRLEIFDLLIDKKKSIVKVSRIPKKRSLVSDEMFTILKSEMIRQKI